MARATSGDAGDGTEDRDGGKGRKRSSGAIRRTLSYAAFLPIASRAPSYTRLVWALLRDERTPLARKAVLAAGAGYLVIGRDIVPDSIPILGGLDDLVVVVLAVELFLDGIPTELLHEKLDELGIERTAFEQDVAQIRRLTPKPVRKAIGRVPDALGAVARTVGQTGIGPRLRSWVNREGSPA